MEPCATRNIASAHALSASHSVLARYTEHAVNMRAAQICRLQHGFGQVKVSNAWCACLTP